VSARFVVKNYLYIRGTPDSERVYLQAIAHRPRRDSGPEYEARIHTTEQRDAFKFRSRAAAEMAAVTVGGWVVRLRRKAVTS
jgi:hypothetical protein